MKGINRIDSPTRLWRVPKPRTPIGVWVLWFRMWGLGFELSYWNSLLV